MPTYLVQYIGGSRPGEQFRSANRGMIFCPAGENVEVDAEDLPGLLAQTNEWQASSPDAIAFVPGLPAFYGPLRHLVANPELIVTGSISYNGSGAPTSASLRWPDGATGTFTSLTYNASRPALVDSYRVTYVTPTGVTTTFTQPAVTRDANGMVTSRPDITQS